MKTRATAHAMILSACLAFLSSCAHTAAVQAPQDAPAPPAAASTARDIDAPGVSGTPATQEDAMRASIVEALVSGGVDPGLAATLVGDPRLELDPAFILKNLSIAPPKAAPGSPGVMGYDPAYISRGRAFIDANRGFLADLERIYGTSPEILTAVLIVESRLGTYPMRYRVFGVLASMALARDRSLVESLAVGRPSLGRLLDDEGLFKTASSKASWASRELPHLVALAGEIGKDPLEIMGSVSGALGPAQFIPSTFRKYGRDGNGDGKTDPFDMQDALASMAGYIRSSGWREGSGEAVMRSALWHYNHSDVYANTVLKIYRELLEAGAAPGGPVDSTATPVDAAPRS